MRQRHPVCSYCVVSPVNGHRPSVPQLRGSAGREVIAVEMCCSDSHSNLDGLLEIL